jgi:hypothetical protein
MTSPLAKQADRYIETQIDDEIVLMDLDSGNFFSLTDSAVAVWTLIDGTRDRDAIVAALCAEYACEADAIAGDVDAFLAQVGGAGFTTGS